MALCASPDESEHIEIGGAMTDDTPPEQITEAD